jgi:hypothetical protein
MTERIPLIYNPSSNQLQEVSLADETSVGILSVRVISNPNYYTNEVVSLANSSFNYGMFGPVTVGTAATITVGSGVSFVIY